jgi:AcrR family transcriptional regulator
MATSQPQRRHARNNQARILATARDELSRNPDVTLDEIARAAGVVRRTVYGHFPNRQALLGALADEAAQVVTAAATAARRPGADPATALARMTMAVWAAGDRYRMLISLGRQALGTQGIRTALAPIRDEALAILARGQREDVFADHLPAPVLTQALEAVTLTLMEIEAQAGWDDPTGEAAATAVLIAAGMAPDSARRRIQGIVAEQKTTFQDVGHISDANIRLDVI